MAKMKKTKIDENLLTMCSRDMGIDPKLPFRLQKRELFEKLGFPIDKKIISMPVKDERKIRKTLNEFMKEQSREKNFLIITSPKPMSTWIPPLFRVNREERTAIYRDDHGNTQQIDLSEVLIKIRTLPPESWVEFARHLWKKETVAGRLVYVSVEEQILEIQKGVGIPEMDKNPAASFQATLSFFELSDSPDDRNLMYRLGLDWNEVKRIIHSLGECYRGFRSLKQIANLPALEFAYNKQEGLIVVDVDWPAQYHL